MNSRDARVHRLLKRVLARLSKSYGRPMWKRWGKVVPVLVDTILSQNTSNKNSDAGFRRLRRRFVSWNSLADASVDEVVRCIRVCGLSRIKAPRIIAIVKQIRSDRGRIDLEHLADLPPAQAFDYLTGFEGVGPKTAACVLLFSLGMPLFPVDTHIHRIARRLRAVGPKVSAVVTQEKLTPLIAPADRYAMHILIIRLGREICLARNPRCEWCGISDLCPSATTKTDYHKGHKEDSK